MRIMRLHRLEYLDLLTEFVLLYIQVGNSSNLWSWFALPWLSSRYSSSLKSVPISKFYFYRCHPRVLPKVSIWLAPNSQCSLFFKGMAAWMSKGNPSMAYIVNEIEIRGCLGWYTVFYLFLLYYSSCTVTAYHWVYRDPAMVSCWFSQLAYIG